MFQQPSVQRANSLTENIICHRFINQQPTHFAVQTTFSSPPSTTSLSPPFQFLIFCYNFRMENEFNFDNLPSLNKKSEPIVVFTDGGCHGNPGPGGWACVIIADGEARQLSGGEKLTTNNKMELTAAISALSAIYNTERLRNLPIELNIDSQYVKNGITGWIFGWKKNGWKTAAKKPVLNRELWEKLDALNSALNVEWKWVKGHAGVEYNEVCDQLCQEEIAKFE